MVACSNLSRKAIGVTLVAARPDLFDSDVYADHRVSFRVWAGMRLPRDADVVFPIHPWHLEFSPVVRGLTGGDRSPCSKRASWRYRSRRGALAVS